MKIVVFDIESTGISTKQDRIVQLTLLEPEERQAFSTLVNPGIPIPKEATMIHGITDAMVKDAPYFNHIASAVQGFIDNAILAGYNTKRFDVPLLHAELQRAKQPGIPLDKVAELDAYHLWNVLEPRNLATATRRFAPDDLRRSWEFEQQSHDSYSDTVAAWLVIQGLLRSQGLSIAEAVNLCKTYDRYNRFLIKEGTVCYNFGKHKGEPVKNHLDYARWLMRQDTCDDETKTILLAIMEENNNGRQ